MHNVLPLLFAETTLGAKIMAGVLWTGVGALTIALVVLLRTRFGQARPLSKCIALSVYAHVLLMTYAYATKLVIPSPVGDASFDDVVQLHLVDGQDEQSQATEQNQPDVAHAPAPWEPVAAITPTDFSLSEPARLDTQTPLEQGPEASEVTPPPVDLTAKTDLIDTPASPSASEAPPLDHLLPKAAAIPIAIAVPEVKRHETVDSLQPQAAGPARLSTAEVTPSEVELPALSGSETEAGSPAQQLAELLSTPDLAQAIAASTDKLSASSEQVAASGVLAVTAGETATLAWIHQQLNSRVPRRLADGEPVPELYRMRLAPERHRIARRLGATKESDKVVEEAVRWLSISQSEDGRWSAKQFGAGDERKVLGQDRQGAGSDADAGITGLALLAMLGAGHTHLEGPYRENVQRGLEFLVRQQKEDGAMSGDAKLYATMYCHGMASLALSEAYAMTGDHRLKPFVEKAGAYSIRAQHSTTGGWRYLPGDPGDMSQFGWQVMALKSGELGGVAIPDKTKNGMTRFLHNNTSGSYRGLASYRAGERPSRTMTAEAFACRVLLGQECGTEMTDEAVSFILQDLPHDGQPDFYYWYYGSLAMFQLQDERWATWNSALQKQLIARQEADGDMAGSFGLDEVWSGYGGRVYTTSIAALCLEVYYRYLPVYGSELSEAPTATANQERGRPAR